MSKPKDITDQRFGRLVAIVRLADKDCRGSFLWAFKCDCGKLPIKSISSVTSGEAKSCGCLQKEVQQALRKNK